MDTRGKGREGEARAERFLNDRGYRTVARNFRTRRGEVDLIVEKAGCLCFVEVKSWGVLGVEDLEYAIDARKQRRIRDASRQFIWQHPEYAEAAVDYEVIFIGPPGTGIKHFEHAFDGV